MSKTDVNAKDNNGANALTWCIYYGDLILIKSLIHHGASVADSAVIYIKGESKGYIGSVQAIATHKGNLDVLEYLIDSIGLLIDEKEFNPYSRRKEGSTALNYAAEHGVINIVKYLLQKGAKVDVIDGEISTPIIRAVENEQWAIFDLLIKTDVYKKRFGDQADYFVNAISKFNQQFATRTAKQLQVRQLGLELRKEFFGDSSLGYANGLIGLGSAYDDSGEYGRAEELFQEAIGIIKKKSREDHPLYMSTLNCLAFTCFNMGRYEKAISFLENALSYTRRVYGEENPDYAISLKFLALAYVRMGYYDKAMPLYPRILAIIKKVQGEENGSYTMTLNHFAYLYTSLGQYKEAIFLYQEALAIIKNIWGIENDSYGGNLIDLAYAYYHLSQYKEALPLFEQASDIIKKSLGEKHQYYALAINGLAFIYERIGEYNKATNLHKQVLTIIKKALGEGHPLYAYSLNNLAALYITNGEYNKAFPLYQQALAIRKKALKEEHPDYAQSLNNLAVLYEQREQYDTALHLYRKALILTKKAVGEEHQYYADCLSNLASLYSKTGKYDLAMQLYHRALSINKKVMGESFPGNVNILNSLGLLYKNSGDDSEALSLFIEANRLQLKHLWLTYSTLSEGEKMIFLNRESSQFCYLPSLLYLKSSISSSAVQQLYQNELSLKGMVLSDQENVLAAIRKSNDNTAVQLYNEWRFNTAFIGKQQLLPVSNRVVYFDSLLQATNSLEQKLSRLSSDFNSQLSDRNISAKHVAKKLKSKEAAIEFVRFQIHDNKWTDSTIYVALLLLPNDSVPKFIPLCEEKQLQQLLKPYASASPQYSIQKLYPGKPSAKNDSLYRLIWKSLEKYLTGINTVYYAPTGLLHRISFPAITTASADLLIDKYQLNQVLSTRSVAQQKDEIRKPSIAGVWGNIRYGNTMDDALASRGLSPAVNSNVAAFNFYASDTSNLRGQQWNNLPETKKEVDSLKVIFKKANVKTTTFTGDMATEEAFKAFDGKSPTLLHLATHGFFLPVADKKDSEKSIANTFTVQQNPMFRSGLVLAGGNRTWKGESLPVGKEDGILTAYEIAQMDLSNTDLVVLSACETALGDLQGNEGVIGLQRAFKLAGVKQMIISLWQVPDKATRELMTIFYKNWLGGLSTREALRNAQLKMKQKYSPYFWAAFVLVE